METIKETHGLLETVYNLNNCKTKWISVGWFPSKDCKVCAQFTHSNRGSVILDEYQWYDLVNQADLITDYFKVNVKNSYFKYPVKFVKYFGKKHLLLKSEFSSISFNSNEWSSFLLSIKPLSHALELLINNADDIKFFYDQLISPSQYFNLYHNSNNNNVKNIIEKSKIDYERLKLEVYRYISSDRK